MNARYAKASKKTSTLSVFLANGERTMLSREYNENGTYFMRSGLSRAITASADGRFVGVDIEYGVPGR